MRTTTLLLLAAMVAAAPFGQALAREPAAARGGGQLAHNQKQERIPASYYKILGVDFSRQNLIEIQDTLGQSPLFLKDGIHLGVCYFSQDGGFLEYTFTEIFTGYAVAMAPPSNLPRNACLKLPIPSEAMINEAGLALGMNKQHIHKLLGRPSKMLLDATEYHYVYRVREKSDERTAQRQRAAQQLAAETEIWVNIHSLLKVSFERDRVVRFEVSTTESF